VIMAIDGIGFCLMLGAFVLAAGHVGREASAAGEAQGRWSLPTRLMFAGAVLATVSSLLLFLPGVVPWWDYSEPWTAWSHGVLVGSVSAIFYGQVVRAWHRSTWHRSRGNTR
jgi:hypothetical protein